MKYASSRRPTGLGACPAVADYPSIREADRLLSGPYEFRVTAVPTGDHQAWLLRNVVDLGRCCGLKRLGAEERRCALGACRLARRVGHPDRHLTGRRD